MSVPEEALARACHELRGPLHAAGLALTAAARETPGVAERLRAVEVELARLAAVADDLEGLRRGGRGAVRGTRTDVAGLVRAQVSAWSAAADLHGARLRWTGGDGPAFAAVDPRRLAQATGNLIANALEHGGGDVEVRVARAGGEVRVVVRDRGSGLGAPLAALVGGARRRDGGRGRGLAVADAAVRACGGRLATAPSDGGATLVVAVPESGALAA